ncbi:hypothetical protein POM88_046639 [Heracleum sosnowskyi]|uniref:Uncharacterized protein n=1 Tax=Heracleum sosnowskyi TaxID=360622 RepID=A0AAD8H7B4_9APIA|nr:hypothetical protein POM88_046639 [Heracleum sosnowskyi]
MFAKVMNFFSTKRGLLSLFKVHNTRSAASSHFHCSLVSQNPKLFSTSRGSSASAGAVHSPPLAAAATNTKRETENSFSHVPVIAAAVLIIGNAPWAFVQWKKRVMEELNLMDERSMAIGLLINFSKFRELVFEGIKEDDERYAMAMERVKNLEDELKKLAGGGGDASGSGSGGAF